MSKRPTWNFKKEKAGSSRSCAFFHSADRGLTLSIDSVYRWLSRAALDWTDPEHMEASSFSIFIILLLLQLTEGRNQAPNPRASEISSIGPSQTPPPAVHPLVSLLKIDRYCSIFCPSSTTYSSAAVHRHTKWCRRSCGPPPNFAPHCSMFLHSVPIFFRFHDMNFTLVGERVKHAGSYDSSASC